MLYYEGHATTSIVYNADEEDVESALKMISVLQDVDVTFSIPSSGACNTSAINVIQVRSSINLPFLYVHGVSALWLSIFRSTLSIIVVQVVQVRRQGAMLLRLVLSHRTLFYFVQDFNVVWGGFIV